MILEKPKRLLKLLILSEKSKSLEVISTIHHLGLLEITRDSQLEMFSNTSMRNYEIINEKYLKFNDFLKESNLTIELQEDLIDISKQVSDLEVILSIETHEWLFEKIRNLSKSKKEIEREINKLEEEISKLERILETQIEPKAIKFRSLSIKLYKFRGNKEELQKFLESLEKEIERKYDSIINGIIVVEHEASKDFIYLVSFNLSLPRNQRLEEIDLQSYETREELIKSYESLKNLKIEKMNSLAKITQELEKVIEENKKLLTDIKFQLECWKMRYNVIMETKKSINIDMITAWIDEEDLPILKNEFKQRFKDQVKLLILTDSLHDDTAPTKLESKNKIVRNFEGMLKTITIPSSKDLNPSIIFSFLLPLMYGMIVGDIGYAILSIPFAMFLKATFKNSTTINYLSNIWLYSAIFALIFGLLFDEIFGMSFQAFMKIFDINLDKRPLQYLGIDLHLHRVHELPKLMGLTILFGAIIVSLGFLIGSILSFEHDFKHGIGKLAWIFFILSLLILLPKLLFNFTLINVFDKEVEIGSLILGLSIIVIFVTEGVPGIFELAGVVSNIMSFLRIASVGVAGVIIAEIINASFTPKISSDILTFLIIFLIFITLHFANAVIAMAEGMIQGGRLCLVEFSTKYFKGGGRLFTPFTLPVKKNYKSS